MMMKFLPFRIGGERDIKKRNEIILNNLRKLNVMSELEGLLQLLNANYSEKESSPKTKHSVNKYRQFDFLQFLPKTVQQTILGDRDHPLYTEYVRDSLQITAKVRQHYGTTTQHKCKQKQCETIINSEQSQNLVAKFIPCKIFVKNISFKTKQRELWHFFEKYGKVLRATIAKDQRTKRSRGFGFVLFASPLSAERALKARKIELNLDGRYLTVSPATSKKKKGSSSMYNAHKRLKDEVNKFIDTEVDCEGEGHNDDFFQTEEEEEIRSDDKSSSDRGEKDISWNEINEDVLLHIFQYFDIKNRLKIEKVSKRWRNVVLSSWPTLKIMHFKDIFSLVKPKKTVGLTDEILINLVRKGCYNLQVLDLSASPYFIQHPGLSFFCKKCRNLQEINLSQVNLKQRTLKVIGENLIKLKKVILHDSRTVGEKGLWWLLKNLESLESLEITRNTRINGNCFYMLPATLKHGVFYDCHSIGDRGLAYLSCCTHLKSLNFSSNLCVTTDGLEKIFENCVALEDLVLSQLQLVISIPSFKNLTMLRTLDLSANLCVDDETLRNIIHYCTKLRKLNIEACHGSITSEGILLLSSLSAIEDLNISYILAKELSSDIKPSTSNGKVNDACISSFSISGCLKKLSAKACPEVTDEGLASCILGPNDLTELDLSGCCNVWGMFLDKQSLSERNKEIESGKLNIFVGGTDITTERFEEMKKLFSNCLLHVENRVTKGMRNDYDNTILPYPFFPEEDDIDMDEDFFFEVSDEYDVHDWLDNDDDEYFERDDVLDEMLEAGEALWERVQPEEDVEGDVIEFRQPAVQQNQLPVEIDYEEDWDLEID